MLRGSIHAWIHIEDETNSFIHISEVLISKTVTEETRTKRRNGDKNLLPIVSDLTRGICCVNIKRRLPPPSPRPPSPRTSEQMSSSFTGSLKSTTSSSRTKVFLQNTETPAAGQFYTSRWDLNYSWATCLQLKIQIVWRVPSVNISRLNVPVSHFWTAAWWTGLRRRKPDTSFNWIVFSVKMKISAEIISSTNTQAFTLKASGRKFGTFWGV